MTRIDSVRAAAVAIKSSGQMMALRTVSDCSVKPYHHTELRGFLPIPASPFWCLHLLVMIDAGTTIPPIPRPASTRIPQSWPRLSTRAIAIAPQPAVMRIEETIINALLWPRKTERSQRTIQAPAKIEKPMGIPRIPTPLSNSQYRL